MADKQVNKSAKTCQFVSNKDVQSKPATTYKQTVSKPCNPPKKSK